MHAAQWRYVTSDRCQVRHKPESASSHNTPGVKRLPARNTLNSGGTLSRTKGGQELKGRRKFPSKSCRSHTEENEGRDHRGRSRSAGSRVNRGGPGGSGWSVAGSGRKWQVWGTLALPRTAFSFSNQLVYLFKEGGDGVFACGSITQHSPFTHNAPDGSTQRRAFSPKRADNWTCWCNRASHALTRSTTHAVVAVWSWRQTPERNGDGRRQGLTYLCASVGGAWVQCGWGRSGCTRCRCSCGRRRAPPCAAAEPSGSGSASRTAGRRWPCPSLHTGNTSQSVPIMFFAIFFCRFPFFFLPRNPHNIDSTGNR